MMSRDSHSSRSSGRVSCCTSRLRGANIFVQPLQGLRQAPLLRRQRLVRQRLPIRPRLALRRQDSSGLCFDLAAKH